MPSFARQVKFDTAHSPCRPGFVLPAGQVIAPAGQLPLASIGTTSISAFTQAQWQAVLAALGSPNNDCGDWNKQGTPQSTLVQVALQNSANNTFGTLNGVGSHLCGIGPIVFYWSKISSQTEPQSLVAANQAQIQAFILNGLNALCAGAAAVGSSSTSVVTSISPACASPLPNQCGSMCTSLVIDPNNCGVCGNVCSYGQTCTNGSCSYPVTTIAMAVGGVLAVGILVVGGMAMVSAAQKKPETKAVVTSAAATQPNANPRRRSRIW